MYTIGDQIRIKTIPPDVSKMPQETREIFDLCLGNTFEIQGFDQYGHLELWVGHMRHAATEPFVESIWIEPAFVELVGMVDID